MTMNRWLALQLRSWARKRTRSGVDVVLRAAGATMRRSKYCGLATLSASGIDARIVQPLPPDDDFNVWFGTSPTSRKATQLRSNESATLIYQDDRRHAGVVLVGRAQLVTDLDERRKRFLPSWWAFYPQGPEGDDFVLVHFLPQRIEVWDACRRITPEPFGLRSAQVIRVGGGWGEERDRGS